MKTTRDGKCVSSQVDGNTLMLHNIRIHNTTTLPNYCPCRMEYLLSTNTYSRAYRHRLLFGICTRSLIRVTMSDMLGLRITPTQQFCIRLHHSSSSALVFSPLQLPSPDLFLSAAFCIDCRWLQIFIEDFPEKNSIQIHIRSSTRHAVIKKHFWRLVKSRYAQPRVFKLALDLLFWKCLILLFCAHPATTTYIVNIIKNWSITWEVLQRLLPPSSSHELFVGCECMQVLQCNLFRLATGQTPLKRLWKSAASLFDHTNEPTIIGFFV